MTPRSLPLIALMAALTAVGAHLRIPLPYVPLTLQPAVVCMAGLWLGPRRGATSQVVYLLIGLLGFPVFAKGGGLQYILEPSFGYLLGFIGGAWVVGTIAGGATGDAVRLPRCLLAIVAGLGAIYVFGIAGLLINLHYVVGTDLSAWAIVQLGLLPLPKDLLVGAGAAWAGQRLRRLLPPSV